jgi:hypothetical protein
MILREHDEVRWVSPGELSSYPFAEPDRPIVELLAGEALHD